MASYKSIDINSLFLDLKNYRTVPQRTELKAIQAMIAVKPDRFFAIIKSLLDDGYLPTENLIVLEDGKYIVKEGNRRLAALKIIHGIHKMEKFGIPDNLKQRITDLDKKWFKANLKIPCTVFKKSEIDTVKRIVNLTHAKGEKASRDPWTSVARARQNRDEKGANEHGLDLLEKYLKKGENVNNQQKERWSGDYPLSVLDEALRKIIDRLEYESIANLSKKYPKIDHRAELEEVMLKIGLEIIGFKDIRSDEQDFAEKHGFPAKIAEPSDPDSETPNSSGTKPKSKSKKSGGAGKRKGKSSPISSPKTVKATLKKFTPRGADRQKVVTLIDEMSRINIERNPLAFCFLLRSTFEISVKIYCKEQGISASNKGRDRTLVDLLRRATKKLTDDKQNKTMTKALHGALAEIAKSDGLLSVTSMNQLVHHPTFSISPNDIAILFGNIYPLLEALN